MIRLLDSHADAEAVLDLYGRAADYLDLESGRFPSPEVVAEFFSDAPPGGDHATSLKLGLWEGDRLLGIADVAFGYPERCDAYLGLMILAGEARGRGLGPSFLSHIEEAARGRGATRLLLAVLEANPRARTFWEREGFGAPRTFPPVQSGIRVHVRIQFEKPL